MKIFLIVIFSLFSVICDGSHANLTTRENEIRLGSCGDPAGEPLWLAKVYKIDGFNYVNQEREKAKSRKTSKTPVVETTFETTTKGKEETTTEVEGSTDETSYSTESTTVEMTTEMTTAAEKVLKYETTNAVFISQTHLLLASSWFLLWNHNDNSWHWKFNTTRVDDSVCKTNPKESFRTRSTYNYVMDYRKDWRKVEEIILLRFCEMRTERNGFLALIVVNRTVPPIPTICLPKAIQQLKPKVTLSSFKRKSIRTIGKLGNITKCIGDDGVYYNIIGNCTHDLRGSPMITNDQFGVQRLHGVIAIENQSEPPYYHIIQLYMDEMCRLLKICRRDVEQIGLTPGRDDEKFTKSIDDDYADQLAEPDILEYNGKEKRMSGIGIAILIFMIWFLK